MPAPAFPRPAARLPHPSGACRLASGVLASLLVAPEAVRAQAADAARAEAAPTKATRMEEAQAEAARVETAHMQVAQTHAAQVQAPQAPAAQARSRLRPDQVFLQASRSEDSNGVTIGLAWTWRSTIPLGRHGELGGLTELTLGQWHIFDRAPGAERSASAVGLTPSVRWRPSRDSGLFLEAGLGVNLIVPVYATADKRFSTTFNFGEHIGIGWRTGGERRWEWSLRLQHFSNAGIRRPNPGEDFVQLRVAASF